MISTVAEKHYKVDELAEKWGVSPDTVTRAFQNEPGVLKLTFPRLIGSKRKAKTMLRIPASVAERVYERWTARPAVTEMQFGRRRVK